MKALQTRSPIHLYYDEPTMDKVNLSIWVKESPTTFNTNETPNYQLTSEAINSEVIFEISELLRSVNQYEFDKNFYNKRDTAIYVLCKADLLDSNGNLIEPRYNFLRIRDGYVERNEQTQVLNNKITSDFRNWTNSTNTNVLTDRNDPFGGTDAYSLNDNGSSTQRVNTFLGNLNIQGMHTFSVWLNSINKKYIIQLNDSASNRVSFDKSIRGFFDVGSNVLAVDIFRINFNFRISFVTNLENINSVRIFSDNVTESEEVTLFNPTFTRGNHINAGAEDLVLQDNLTAFSTTNEFLSFQADRKFGNSYKRGANDLIPIFNNNNSLQSIRVDLFTVPLEFENRDGVQTSADLRNININECKYTPVKVSFINRFGVIQDLVFFKKRIDSIDTDKESYKTNVLQQGNYYPHIGQNQTIRKESKRSVTLNTGFYPEEFNTVFEQLQNSLHYWIDDEPAVLEGSSFNVKTRVNDKLINYTFDFSYSNEEVNTI